MNNTMPAVLIVSFTGAHHIKVMWRILEHKFPTESALCFLSCSLMQSKFSTHTHTNTNKNMKLMYVCDAV